MTGVSLSPRLRLRLLAEGIVRREGLVEHARNRLHSRHIGNRRRFTFRNDAHFDFRIDGFNAHLELAKEEPFVLLNVVELTDRPGIGIKRLEIIRHLPAPLAHEIPAQERHIRANRVRRAGLDGASRLVVNVVKLVFRFLVVRVELRLFAQGRRYVLVRIHTTENTGTDMLEPDRSRVHFEQEVTTAHHGPECEELAAFGKVRSVIHLSQRRVGIAKLLSGGYIAHDGQLGFGDELLIHIALVEQRRDIMVQVLHGQLRPWKVRRARQVDPLALIGENAVRDSNFREIVVADVNLVRAPQTEQPEEVRDDGIRQFLQPFDDRRQLLTRHFDVAKLVVAEHRRHIITVISRVCAPSGTPTQSHAARIAQRHARIAIKRRQRFPTAIIIGIGDVNAIVRMDHTRVRRPGLCAV